MSGGGLVTVFTAATEFEAQAVAAVLEEAGVDAVAFPLSTNGLGVGMSLASGALGVPVQVREEDVERAERALKENAFLAASVDWDSVDVGEEEGGSPPLPRWALWAGHAAVRAGWVAALGLVGLTVLGTLWILASGLFG